MNRYKAIDKSAKSFASFVLIFFVVAGYFVAAACANRGAGPQGGPKDINPPHPLKSIPKINSTNYKKNRIEIVFDEIILVEKAFDNVVVSPPQKQPPIIKAIGKKLVVELKDTLLDNTTYTVDFGNAIVDNNEKNVLEGYSFCFSTGNTIDSMQIAGNLVMAKNMNPVANIYVGIHSDLSDSVFIKKAFDRVSKTDKNGRFVIKNIKPGKYKVYALGDIGNNFRFDLPNEPIAFVDSVFTTSFETKIKNDTIYRDSIYNNKKDTVRMIDSVVSHLSTKFYPDSLVLRLFEEVFYNQYLVKSERKERQQFSLYFNESNDSLPKIEALNFPFEDKVFIQATEKKDTITYWLTDSIAWQTDTLNIKLTYQKTDSNSNMVSQTDTLYLRSKKTDKKTSRQRAGQGKKQEFLSISTNASSAFNYFDSISISFQSPVFFQDAALLRIEQKVDTNWVALASNFLAFDSTKMKFVVESDLKPEQTYRLSVDSAMFRDLYGRVNNKFSTPIVCKSKDVYGTLTIEFGELNGKEIVELLNKNDDVIKRAKIIQKSVTFSNLNAGTYYARIFVDDNENGEWDSGKYSKRLQPESVYYYPYSFVVRQLWDSSEYWDYLEFPILQQKPQELIKEEKPK